MSHYKGYWQHLLAGLLVLMIILTGCAAAVSEPAAEQAAPAEAEQAEGEEAAPAEEAAETGNIFIYAHPTSFPDMDPAKSFSNDSVVMGNCYETLTFYNPPGSETLLSPKLATSWETNDEATEWTFQLREGVTFHNGKPFTAEDVKRAVEKTKEVGVGASYIWDPVEEIEVIDDHTIRFNLAYAAPLDLIASAGYSAWIYDVDVYEEQGSDWYNEGNCVGTGPYTIDSYERGSRLVMNRYDDYWGGWSDGQFDRVVFEISEDPVVLQQKIESGEADFTYQIPPDNIPAMEARDDVVVYMNPGFQNLVGLFNTQKPPLDDPNVRRALSYSFPYEAFIEGVMQNRATQATGPVPAGMWGHSDDLPQYNYDLDMTRELLTEAGYPDGGFDLLYTYATGDLDEQQAGELWKAELAKLGINLELQGMNWEAQWDLARSGPENAQDIFVMYWWPDYVSPYSFLYSMFHSEEDILFNLGYYSNPEYDELIDTGFELSGSDREEATQQFIDAQKILIADAVSMFFYDVANTHLARADIQGYQDNPAYPHIVFVYELTRQ